ncbi:glutathione S-transferase family protein [Uliginosibacterium sp. H1]|uniref:glutathione S-transferase family protein n=1 Tax=Uliginosibacterium sp. H1 TaxID=3114757 RepID=UPI002E17B7EA|nr:glutathione S-transferase N-terminal domain-containing protein [Uliginosibacterium sp. H1]
MYTLYYWPTPNGQKVSLMLEELGVTYEVKPINIGRGDQFAPEFLALNPNHKIPVLVDSNGPEGKPITLVESGAILLYLAGKYGRFLADDVRGKYEALQWLMFQMGSVGPMLGQAHHFLRAPQVVPYGVARYVSESRRIYGVLESRLQDEEWLASDEYSVADIATWPWIHRHAMHQARLADFPGVKDWYERISKRPAVRRMLKVQG